MLPFRLHRWIAPRQTNYSTSRKPVRYHWRELASKCLERSAHHRRTDYVWVRYRLHQLYGAYILGESGQFNVYLGGSPANLCKGRDVY
jgi:hypothetical protein